MNNNNKGTTLLVIGMMFTALGSTIFADHGFLQYGALFLGLFISVYSVLVFDKAKKMRAEIQSSNKN